MLLLMAIAVIGIAAASAVGLGAALARRDAERQLLAIGAEFETALNSYAGVPAGTTAAPTARGPRNLEDLLKDSRQPGIRRHLRRIYADPLTGKEEWGLVRDSHGLIVGLYSMAEGRPLQRAGWPAEWAHFEEQEAYASWLFGYRRSLLGPAN